MEFTFIADVHLTEFKNDKQVEYDRRIVSRKTASIVECLHEVCQYTEENISQPYMIISGDMVDKHAMEYSSAILFWMDIFDKYSNIEFLIITGNHDISDKSDNPFNWCNVFSKYNNVEIIDYAKYKDIGDGILAVSYSNKLQETLRNAVQDNPQCDILLSHFDVNEAKLSNNLTGIGKIKFSDLASKFRLILLGDYHIPQKLQTAGSELYYVGSVIQKDWGEANEEKRFFHCKIDRNNIDIKSIPFTRYSKHIILECTSREDIPKLVRKKKELVQQNHYVKILYKIESTMDKKEVRSLKNEIGKLADEEVILVEELQETVTEQIDIKSKNVDKLYKYLEIKGIDEKDRDKFFEPISEFLKQ